MGKFQRYCAFRRKQTLQSLSEVIDVWNVSINIVTYQQICRSSFRQNSICALFAEELLDDGNSKGFGCSSGAFGGFDSEARHTDPLEILKQIAVI
jgi:hypothetical protein